MPAGAQPPLPGCVWLPGLQVLAARDRAGSTAGWFVAAKGGHNAESHNHNDVGHFVVFRDGCPLLVDAGVEVYSRQTFSAERYRIWTMQSAWHNLPTINGIEQAAGRQFAAREVTMAETPAGPRLTLELAGAYPAEAGVTSWRRTVALVRGQGVTVRDGFTLAAVKAPLHVHLLTASPVTVGAGRLELAAAELPDGRRSAAGMIAFPAGWTATVEERPVADPQVGRVWGARLFRVTLTLAQPPLVGVCELRITGVSA
jgi:hypothetical protein